MDKEAILQEVYEEAFKDELNKQAGLGSELVGSFNPVSIAGSPALLLGLLAGKKTKKGMKKQDKKMLSNLIPTVGAYRLGRRIRGVEE